MSLKIGMGAHNVPLRRNNASDHLQKILCTCVQSKKSKHIDMYRIWENKQNACGRYCSCWPKHYIRSTPHHRWLVGWVGGLVGWVGQGLLAGGGKLASIDRMLLRIQRR